MAINELGERLALIIDARTEGAVSNVRKLAAEEQAAADRAEVLKAKLADLEARAARSPGSKSTAVQLSRTRAELAGLESTLATVPAGAGRAEGALAKLGLQGTVTGGALVKGLEGAAAAGLAIGAFEYVKHGVELYGELATQIRAVAQASGASAPEASKIVEITNALGLSSDQVALGLFRLGKNIDLTPQKLAGYNVAVARTKDGNADLVGTLFNVADAYQHTQDPARKAGLVFQAFGRAGTSMLPILNANREQLEEIAKNAQKHGLLFSAQDLQQARDLQVATHELHDSLNALSIAGAKTLVPVLTDVANLTTKVTDFANGPGGSLIKDIGKGLALPAKPFLLPFKFVFGGGSSSAKAQAQAEVASEAAQQARAADQAAAAGLATAASGLAGRGQNLADAKQNLKDARQALADAVSTRNKAAKDLATVKAGAPGATATAVEAAVARVHAAELKLRAANYVGGDARIATAQASLLSAQNSLNKLREQGGTSTTKLAAATERLHKANEAVTAARQKEQAAQRAKNQATGLSAADVQHQVDALVKDQTAHVGAITKLASLGATPQLTAYLDTLDKQTPGTLVKFAKGAKAGLVAKLDAELGNADTLQQTYNSILGDPQAWNSAGQQRGIQFAKGFASSIGDGGVAAFLTGVGLPIAAPNATRRAGRTTAYAGDRPGVTQHFNGPITVQAQDPDALGRKLSAKHRHAALSGLPGNRFG